MRVGGGLRLSDHPRPCGHELIGHGTRVQGSGPHCTSTPPPASGRPSDPDATGHIALGHADQTIPAARGARRPVNSCWPPGLRERPMTGLRAGLRGCRSARHGAVTVDVVPAQGGVRVPLRARQPSMNRALMARLVDRVQVTLFPVITGDRTGPDLRCGDFDLELIEPTSTPHPTGYRPTSHESGRP